MLIRYSNRIAETVLQSQPQLPHDRTWLKWCFCTQLCTKEPLIESSHIHIWDHLFVATYAYEKVTVLNDNDGNDDDEDGDCYGDCNGYGDNDDD